MTLIRNTESCDDDPSTGRRLVPTKYEIEGFKLGTWVHTQRTAWRRDEMRNDRLLRLEEAGMVWEPQALAWEDGFAHFIAEPLDESGRRRVTPYQTSSDGFKLGRWQHMQRSTYQKGMLSDERARRLTRAGMVWDLQDDAFEVGLAHFEAFPADEEGRRVVPQRYVTETGYKLGSWQSMQRLKHRRGELDGERTAALEKAGVVWEKHEASWLEGFAHFVAYPPDSRGKRLVPQTHVFDDGYRLGNWLTTQRAAYNRGELDWARIQQLEAAGIVWKPMAAAWEQGYKQLLAYPLDEHGRRVVPPNYESPDGFKLGVWQHTQRTAKMQGVLSKEREARLHAAGMQFKQPTKKRGVGREGGVGRSEPPPAKGTKGATRGRVRACEPQRSRRELADVFASGELSSEMAWHAEWRRRLGCWWLTLPGPLQMDLGGCLGALSLHLGGRLDALLRQPTRLAPNAEPGCEWVTEAEQIELPELPSLGHSEEGSFGFSLPPIPRLLPSWEELQLHSRLSAPVHGGVLREQLAAFKVLAPARGTDKTTAISGLSTAAGVGAGGSMLGLGLVVVLRCLNGRLLSGVARAKHVRAPRSVTAPPTPSV